MRNRFQNLKSKHLLLTGLACLVLGYLCLSHPPANGFVSLTLAPILLVLGYGLLIPLALLRMGKEAS